VEALALRPEDRFLEVEAPDFSPGGRAFKPAENTPLLKLRALALVASPQAVETYPFPLGPEYKRSSASTALNPTLATSQMFHVELALISTAPAFRLAP
jgi:hypothetical protein